MTINKKILFYADTNFQLLYSFIINELIIDEYSTFLISRAKNERINEIAINFKTFKNILTVNRSNKSNYILKIIEEKNNINLIINKFNSIKPDVLIIFKDNDAVCKSLIDIASDNGVKIVFIQEGLALYNNSSNGSRRRFKTIIKNIIQKMLKYPIIDIEQGEDDRISTMVVSNKKLLSKSRRKNKQIIEFPMVQPPTYILNKFIKETNLNFDDILSINSNKTIIYFGQPLSEQELIDKKVEKLFLDKLFDAVRFHGFNIIVKPHPSENISKYLFYEKCLIYNESYLPAEVLAFIARPRLVLTPYSSAALNISNWYPTSIIYLYKLIPEINIEIENEVLINNNTKCQIVNKYDELSKLLEEDFSWENNENQYVEELCYKEFVEKLINV